MVRPAIGSSAFWTMPAPASVKYNVFMSGPPSAFLFIVGTVLELLPVIVMFLPTLVPIQAQVGIDQIHFAIVVSLNLMLGMVTPPVGMLLFVVSAVGREPMDAIVSESAPFVLWMAALIILIILFPPIVTWLPSVAF